MSLYNTEAINLKVSRFSEADKLMVLFTRHSGKVSAIAKSAFKPKSKFGARMEVFAYNNVLLAKGRNLDIVSQAETIETFQDLRSGEEKLCAALYMARVLYYFLEDRIKHEALFELFLESLNMLKAGMTADIVTRMFDVKFADIEGVLPINKFTPDMKARVRALKEGVFDCSNYSRENLDDIDNVLLPLVSEHVGKDVRSWRSL